MKKKTLLFAAGLMLTGMFFTTSCKDAVENALNIDCYSCTHPTNPTDYPDLNEVCDVGSLSGTTTYINLGYVCTKK